MADVWRDILIKTIRETVGKKDDGSGFGLFVIQKVKNDVSVNVTIRAGRYYTDKVTGEKKYPKDGLSMWDFDSLNKKNASGTGTVWDEVKPLLDRKNPPKVQPLEAPGQKAEQAERMPWS